MFKTLKNAWRVPEIRKKLLYTLFMIVIFRLGSAITVPFLDPDVVGKWMDKSATNGNFLEYLNIITGGALSQATIFSLSITPFINASIIMQLLTYALPPLERLRDEGEEGQKKLNKITAVVSIILAFFMSYAYYITLYRANYEVEDKDTGLTIVKYAVKYRDKNFDQYFSAAVIILCFVAGAALVVWMGNHISDKGIGNGISMLLFAGIAARFPVDAGVLIQLVKDQPAKYLFIAIGYVLFIIAEIAFIVFMNEAERRIPIQYAKRVVGRKQYGGQKSHIPRKVCMSGVMPIIFAMSFMALPQTIQMFKGEPTSTSGFYYHFCEFFKRTSWSYAILYFLLIIAFNYFYVSIQYNPTEIANNLRQSNGGIPGIRPGKPTSDYIQRVLNKITLVGAFFLGVIAIIPILIGKADNNLMALSMGGTTILIAVSVALETTRTLESHLMMRHHKGFLS